MSTLKVPRPKSSSVPPFFKVTQYSCFNCSWYPLRPHCSVGAPITSAHSCHFSKMMPSARGELPCTKLTAPDPGQPKGNDRLTKGFVSKQDQLFSAVHTPGLPVGLGWSWTPAKIIFLLSPSVHLLCFSLSFSSVLKSTSWISLVHVNPCLRLCFWGPQLYRAMSREEVLWAWVLEGIKK